DRIAERETKQIVTQRERESERGVIYNEYVDSEDDEMTGIIQRIDDHALYVDLGKIEARLDRSEQIPTEQYHIHDRIKVYVKKVDNGTRGPSIDISRANPGLLK